MFALAARVINGKGTGTRERKPSTRIHFLMVEIDHSPYCLEMVRLRK